MIRPLFLLADSQVLFWKDGNRLFTERIREQLDASNPAAAYLGASNGDNPEFYALFQAAMELIDVQSCRMVPSSPSNEDKKFLASADLVLLAGGDVELGWKSFQQTGIEEMLVQRRYEGAVLVGVSAGAVQLGLGTLLETSTMRKLSTFQFAPFYVDAHAEESEWWNLKALVNLAGEGARGIGIPAGGALIYSPDGTLEPIRKTLTEFFRQGDRMSEQLLLPETGS
ncbi:MAG TPA: Type 1 glutamine amidotransferase-like domain-containing protein [Candidatus Angelobacter sp.]|nr:Type 1 glutamine amidotransferase-like domain-containing protein [Candidatus Angelobacter sp.]HKE33093.1 Type 1 glutamine amidotransferase-like domain-containing protein [Candidatus Angelobacter sp.]